MANFDLNEKMFNELVSFIRNSIGESNMPIMRETQLEGDLGVTGAEAYNLIVAFGEKYNVDIRNFDFSLYFYDEPTIFSSTNKILKPFTVGHLEQAIAAGRLDEEVIDNWHL